MITHDLGAIAEIADRVAIMYLSNVIEVGSVEENFMILSTPILLLY